MPTGRVTALLSLSSLAWRCGGQDMAFVGSQEDYRASALPPYPTQQLVEVYKGDRRSMVWPCCAHEQTRAFFSIINSGFEGEYVFEMTRREDSRGKDKWDTVFTVGRPPASASGPLEPGTVNRRGVWQYVSLSGARASVRRPRWGVGFLVRDEGALRLSTMSTAGGFSLEPGAISLTLNDVSIPYPASLNSSVAIVHIASSLITSLDKSSGGGQPLRLAAASLVVTDSQLLGAPEFIGPIGALAITASTLRDWARWRTGFYHNETKVVATGAAVIDFVQVTAAGGELLGNVYASNRGDISCREGWQGEECQLDIDECLVRPRTRACPGVDAPAPAAAGAQGPRRAGRRRTGCACRSA
jgi:hypothetical protein